MVGGTVVVDGLVVVGATNHAEATCEAEHSPNHTIISRRLLL